MAVLTTYAIVGVDTKVSPNIELSTAINALTPVDNSPPLLPAKPTDHVYVSITSNLPISELASTISCVKAPSFLDDYYYRIHINPGIIELGNLLSAQSRQIEVWSSYFQSELLNSIDESNVDGLNLYQSNNPPTYFAALESRQYTLTISTSGAPVIDALYKFNFADEQPTLKVTGRRVVVIPNRPKYPLKEALEWKTDIIKSFSGEQRIRLRDAPRQIFSMESVIENNQYTKLKAISYQWAHRVFAVPVWTDAVFVSSIAAGATNIYIDTQNRDFRDADILIVWKSADDFEAIETISVFSDHVELKLPVSKHFVNALVIPARFANTLSGLSFSRDSDAQIKLSANYTVRKNKNLESISFLSTYKSVPVLLDRPISSNNLTDLYIRDVDVFDNDSSAVLLDVKSSKVNVTSKMTFMTFDKLKAFQYRQFIHYLHGKQKTFFIPSWHDEFEILADFSNTATSLIIRNTGFTLYYENQFLYVETISGQRAFCRILSSSVTNDGDEQLNLDAMIGFSATVSQIKICCLLKYVRQDSDTVSIRHDVADEFSFDLNLLEVPYEL